MMASDCVSTSPLSSASAGTRLCGLTARNSGVCCWPPSLVRWIDTMLVGQALEIERDAHAIGGGRAEIGVELHDGQPRLNMTWPARLAQRRRGLATPTLSCAERSVSLLERALERGAVGRIDRLQQAGGRNRARPARARRRSSRPAGVSDRKASRRSARLASPRHQLALLEQRDRARHLGLVHVAVRADRLAGHHAELAERHQHAPFRHADAVALGIDARQRLRDQARQHVEPIGQELLELECWCAARRRAPPPARAPFARCLGSWIHVARVRANSGRSCDRMQRSL